MMIVALGAVSASEDASPLHPTTLYAFVAASNCEVSNSTHDTMLPFIPSMEPGSADNQSRFAANKTFGSRRSSSVINPFIGFAQASISSIDTAADLCSTETCSHVSLGDTRLN
ncbi:hypothetical protein ABVK25_010504 [Lepraria finkii]|uniref:Secreted protein n=1 Tax=Lepraria finkii TaxID=1340010 RepID=A0ABR4AU64_9LECA